MKSRSRKPLRQRGSPGPAAAPPAGEALSGEPAGAPPRAAAARPSGEIAPPLDAASAFVDRWFWVAALLILLVTVAIRLPELALNPFHHDEGVNGFFTTNLVRNGTYTYDPANYHGPSLYYFALLSEVVFGLTTEAMRFVPVVFGVSLVALVFPLRRYLGSLGALIAAGLLALSPGEVYVSRYFIHEMLLVSLTLGVFVSAVFYLDRREPRYLLAGAIAAALLFATKETGIITVLVLLIAVAVANVYLRIVGPMRRDAPPARAAGGSRPAPRPRSVWIDGVEYRATEPRQAGSTQRGGRGTATARFDLPVEHVAGAAIVFLVIYVLLYSSFFTNFPRGLLDSMATFTLWIQHGESTQVQPVYQYLAWMFPIELPILVLGTIGGLVVAITEHRRVLVVIGLWALGITAAYSLITYKTPWIATNMLLPLALLGGYAMQRLWDVRRLRLAVPLVVAAATLFSAYRAVDLNFVHYDTDSPAYPYVYVHSSRDMLALVDEIETVADRAGTGKDTSIIFVSPDYWPLPWYFRDYPKAGFYGQIVDDSIVTNPAPMIVANVNQEADLAPKVTGTYDLVRQYNLRPGVDLALYVRSDLPKE